MLDDATLLRRYSREHSEEAFAELVRRHVDLVYSAALRHVGGSVHRAQDVTQAVFTDLARKAGALGGRSSIAGWLYLSAHHAAAQLRRTEQRREAREQEAHLMNEHAGSPLAGVDWEKLQPVLDESIRQLNETDREAVLLRFFEQRPFAEIGAALKLNEDSARKRVERALEKLRAALSVRGVTSSSAALGLVITDKAVSTAPATLGPQICLAAKSSTPVTTGALSSLKTLVMAHINVSALSVVLLAGVGIVGAERLARSDDAEAASSGAPAAAAPAAATRVARPINPAWRAVIVVGLAADEDQTARLRSQAEALREAFRLRGVGPSAIKIVAADAGAPLTRETVVEALRPGEPPIEETWVVLLGQVARNREGKPAFQLSGPRLTADEFAGAIDAIPGKRLVIVGTTLGGALLPALESLPNTEAISATASSGEINEPRFASSWAEALADRPEADFRTLASEAATRVKAFYASHGIAQAEHAQIVDAAAKTIGEVPVFAEASSMEPPPAKGSGANGGHGK